jgi:WD40 repeat protein
MALALVAVTAPAAQALGISNGKIVFAEGAGPTSSACQDDVYTIDPDGTGQTQLTNTPDCDAGPVWSPDGQTIAFMRATGPVRGSRPSPFIFPSSDAMSLKMAADGSGVSELLPGYDPPLQTGWPDFSADSRFVIVWYGCCGNSIFRYPDPFDQSYPYAGASVDGDPAFSPLGDKVAGVYGGILLHDMNTGTGQYVSSGDDYAPAWSPDGSRVAFARKLTNEGTADIYVVNVDGTGLAQLTTDAADDDFPAWSPDGTKIAFTSNRDGDFEVYTMNPDGTAQTQVTNNTVQDSDPDWQPVGTPVGYPRPRGAGPLQVPLVPAYAECTSPNSEHGAPLAYPSCNPPVQTSGLLTVGTPDANGKPVKSLGSLFFRPMPGDLATSVNEADVAVEISLTDLRQQSDLSDYVPQPWSFLSVHMGLRLTDKSPLRPPTGPLRPSTMEDYDLKMDMECSQTRSDPTIGSTCSIASRANALVPGIVQEGRRAIWQLGQIRVVDPGPDDTTETTEDNTLFAVQGILIP